MENWLTNTCEYDVAHLTEAVRAQFRESQRTKNLVLGILAVGMLIFSLCGLLIRGDDKYRFSVLLSAVMIVLLVYTNLALPGKAAKSQAARIREANGGSRFHFAFREEGLVLVPPSGEESAPIPCGSFSKLMQTQNLILIFTEEKKMLLLDRARFQHGTEADFWKLMGEKCPAALPKKRRDS